MQRKHDLTLPYFQGENSWILCRNEEKGGNARPAWTSCTTCAHFLVRIRNASCISSLCSDLPAIKADSAFILVFSVLSLTFSVHETWIFRQYRSLFLTGEANTSDWYPYFFGKEFKMDWQWLKLLSLLSCCQSWTSYWTIGNLPGI